MWTLTNKKRKFTLPAATLSTELTLMDLVSIGIGIRVRYFWGSRKVSRVGGNGEMANLTIEKTKFRHFS